MLSLIYRTVLHALTRGFMRTRTQMHILKLYGLTSPSALEISLSRNASVFSQTRNPGWRVRGGFSSGPMIPPSGQGTEPSTPRSEQIRSAKYMYRKKIQGQPGDNNPRQVWQGIQDITNYRGTDTTTINADASLAEELNSFFSNNVRLVGLARYWITFITLVLSWEQTHLKASDHARLKRGWVVQIYHSSFQDKARGVPILLHKSIPFTHSNVVSDPNGRFIIVISHIYYTHVIVVNIYAPNYDDEAFFKCIFSILPDMSSHCLILGGDSTAGLTHI